MTHPWTLDHSRQICRRLFDWPTVEQNRRLFLRYPEQRPAWLPTCAIPDWPNDPGAAAMALARIQMDGWRVDSYWALGSFCVILTHRITGHAAERAARNWPEAVVLAVLAAVEA